MKQFLLVILCSLFIYNLQAQVVSQKIGSSPGFFGYSNLGQKQIYIRNNLNMVAFVFRNNPSISGAGNSGHLRYNVSQDRGLSWAIQNSGIGIGNLNPMQLRLARYPNCILFSNGAGTNGVHLGVLSANLSTSGAGWEGFTKISVAPNLLVNINTPIIEQEDYALLEGPVFPQHITERVSGEFWATLYGVPDSLPNDTMYVLKGTYNATNQEIDWQYNDKLIVPWDTTVLGAAIWSMPKIEFSPDGTMGYVCVIGKLIGGQNGNKAPILWEYNPTTTHFTGGYEVDFTQFPTLGGNPICSDNFDLSVDYQGNAHILSMVNGYLLMDITKDSNLNWNMLTIENPMSSETSMHLSRSEDGKFVFYTWSESDTTGAANVSNDFPNLKGCFYDVVNDLISPIVDWTTNDTTWSDIAFAPKTANRVFETGANCPGRSFNVPTVVTKSIQPVPESEFFYFSNIHYDCMNATLTTTWLYTCATNPIIINPTTVNPFCAQANGSITLGATGGLGSIYSYQIMNGAGNTISFTNSATGLSVGNYVGLVTDSMGCTESMPIVLTSGAITTTAAITNINCNGDSTGMIQLSPIGGSGSYSYSWTVPAGATPIGNVANAGNLIAGNYTAFVTDGTCSDTISVDITQPAAIIVSSNLIALNSSISPPYTGVICLDTITGGVPPYIFSWSYMTNGLPFNPDTSGNCIINLPNGISYLIVTDSLGCSNSDTIVMNGAMPYIQENLNNITLFKVYPNPASNTLHIDMALKQADDIEISLVSIEGKILISKPLSKISAVNELWKISNLAKGTYFLKVNTSEGITTEKIVIE